MACQKLEIWTVVDLAIKMACKYVYVHVHRLYIPNLDKYTVCVCVSEWMGRGLYMNLSLI